MRPPDVPTRPAPPAHPALRPPSTSHLNQEIRWGSLMREGTRSLGMGIRPPDVLTRIARSAPPPAPRPRKLFLHDAGWPGQEWAGQGRAIAGSGHAAAAGRPNARRPPDPAPHASAHHNQEN